MSDLAPFVAAALRDKVVEELLEENRRLRNQVQSFQRVRITGKNGFPIYTEQDFTSGRPTDHGWWVVRLPHRNNGKCDTASSQSTNSSSNSDGGGGNNNSEEHPIPCPMSQLAECEIHVGNFRNMVCRDFNDCFFDGNPKGYFSLFATKGLWLCCFLENVTDQHYQSLCRAVAEEHAVHNILQQDFEEPMQDLTVYFTHLTFCGGSATEATRNLELVPHSSRITHHATTTRP